MNTGPKMVLGEGVLNVGPTFMVNKDEQPTIGVLILDLV